MEAGWPASTLLIAVVRQGDGSGHAVLMVRTDRGDLVLDNQEASIRVWNETPYQYIKRQSQAHAGQWVDMIDTHMTIVAANQ
jgi:predicted transglutaminase-like cysteine proteinase